MEVVYQGYLCKGWLYVRKNVMIEVGQRQELFSELEIQGSVYVEKRFNVQRVPTIAQVQEFLQLMPFGSRWHAFFTLGFLCGLRPIEICNLTTDSILTENGRWVGLIYAVGKPKPPGRPKKGEAPKKAIRKWNRILEVRGDFAPGALDSLKAYWMKQKTFGLLFPKAYTQYGKAFSLLRAQMIARGHDNWAASSQQYFRHLKDLTGDDKVEHDITPYSTRRFFVSCYHWLRSAENRNGVPDIIETQKRLAHSGCKDTQVYIYPWRDLGIHSDQIGKGWDVLTGVDPHQSRLNQW